MNHFSAAFRWAGAASAELLWPSRCAACDAFVPADDAFCGPCQTSVTGLDDPCARCATPLHTDGRCARCSLSPWPFAQARSGVHYGGAVATALVRFKHGRQDIARSLVPLALAAVATALGALREEGRRVIVPVPLHGRRLRARGFNQAAALARGAARLLPSSLRCAVDLWCLARVRDGAHVAHESVAARHQRAQDAFAVRHAARVRGCHIVLVDDVLTTGATSCACAAVLLKAGARSVSVATVARAL